MPSKQPINPFYAALLPAGVAFGLTACAFVVLTVRGSDPQHAAESGLIALLARHGLTILMTELAVLAILTVAAITTDDFWVRRCAMTEGKLKAKDQT
jgi:hypothetical protein